MRKLIGLAVSVILLAVIYWQIDVQALLTALSATDPWVLLPAAALMVPVTFLSAWRLCLLMPGGYGLRLVESTRLILMAAVLNLVLPSKLGDLAKAFALTERGYARPRDAVAVVVLDKAMEMGGMLVWCMVGLALAWPDAPLAHALAAVAAAVLLLCALAISVPGLVIALLRLVRPIAPHRFRVKFDSLEHGWRGAVTGLWRPPTRGLSIIMVSVASWFVHLMQVWLFAVALGVDLPVLANLALAPLAILVGLMPFTLAGIGTRDAALILLYQPYMTAPVAAALGLLFTLRYLLPAIAGLPFLARYLAVVRRSRAANRQAEGV